MDVAGALSEECYLAGMRYGKVDFEVAGDWATRSAADDGPIYMVNFMKYRAVADYDGVKGASGDEARVTGREADDLYAPFEVLKKIGAEIAYVGDVVNGGSPGEWDRMAIVRYASRLSFIEMQNRTDFKEKHVHKEAGMDYTICLGAVPNGAHVDIARRDHVTFDIRSTPRDLASDGDTARLSVEGTVLGDGRRWADLTMTWSADQPVATPSIERGGDRMVVVTRASIDRMGKLLSE